MNLVVLHCESLYPRDSREFAACIEELLVEFAPIFAHCKYHCRPGIEPDPLVVIPAERAAPGGTPTAEEPCMER